MRDERLPLLPTQPAQSALLSANRHHLVRAATRLLGAADAEDAVQDAYVRALENQELELNAAQAWLLTVMRNLAIDRLRRRQWLQQWLAESSSEDGARDTPSAESQAGLAQEAELALRLLALRLTPADGAVVLLHEVFEADHAEIAQAQGKTEAGSRQQLRRALLRLRTGSTAPASSDLEPRQEGLLRIYLHALRLRDPHSLWALLRQPPIRANAGASRSPTATLEAVAASPMSRCAVTQVGGQLGLVLTLDGVTLCVLPLGTRPEHEPHTTIDA
ncbi:RNA polymerase subunit sigma-24 [Hylemonella gracilis str. Niagara R]|uniref:RNA polymerase subunit sigma-24 n=1 Tax=Hylemonella gracilis str. Niagara R TaxID=1458275 RepID=A0A016XK25_9BURK|nr:sigma-70 family RNA polymerase sigma factor [Hylemonella gracilis]EYC52196.1 RNA polymerase subunit sigma-24 [Hylemonella gracilis str. Niagara R]